MAKHLQNTLWINFSNDIVSTSENSSHSFWIHSMGALLLAVWSPSLIKLGVLRVGSCSSLPLISSCWGGLLHYIASLQFDYFPSHIRSWVTSRFWQITDIHAWRISNMNWSWIYFKSIYFIKIWFSKANLFEGTFFWQSWFQHILKLQCLCDQVPLQTLFLCFLSAVLK